MERTVHLFRGLIPAILLNLIFAFGGAASASIVYVKQDAYGSVQDGKSWETAYMRLQAGINASGTGGEVWVAAGTYPEHISLRENQLIYGGFAGTETQRGQRDWKAHPTILDGGGTGDVVASDTVGALIDGFRVSNGAYGLHLRDYATAGVANCSFSNNPSGAIYMGFGGTVVAIACSITGSSYGVKSDSGGTVYLTNCDVRANGWGINLGKGTLVVADCTLTANSQGVTIGGGTASITKCMVSGTNSGNAISVSGATAAVTGCTIERNKGNGLTLSSSAKATISGCRVSGNSNHGVSVTGSATADFSNTTICDNLSSAVNATSTGKTTFANCTVCGNGQGIGLASDLATLTNCIVAFNGSGISRNYPTSGVALSHNDVFGNAAGNYANITDPTGTDGNVSQDPKLSSPYHDVHIQPDSPCIDTGDDSAVKTGDTDVYGKPRIIGAHVDIGSDESDGTTWTVTTHTWYVSPSGDDNNNGASWAGAKKTISGAYAVAQAADEVWVAKGTYAGGGYIPLGVSLYGGFAGTEAARTQRNWRANPSNLSGPVTVNSLRNVLDGFSIQASHSPAVYLGSVNTVANCVVIGSSVGVSVQQGNATVANCEILGNGGGVLVDNGGTANVIDCTINQNTVEGVSIHTGGAASVTNCTITANAKGVYSDTTKSVTITNSIVGYNGAGIETYSASLPVSLFHNDVFGNTTNYVRLADQTGTNGNISQDPKLSNPYHDIHIQPGSPCIDAGDDSYVTTGDTDVYGKPRVIGAHVDIGSDESDGTYWAIPSHTWFVSPTGNDGNHGLTWAGAKRSLTGVLAVAQGTDEVWVAGGTYSGGISIPQGVALYGGFAGTESFRSERRWATNVTVVGSETGSAVVSIYQGGVLDGFTIRRTSGSGIGVNLSVGATTLADCTISGSQTDAAYVDAGSIATIRNCAVCGNAGGIRAYGRASITGCTISGNGSYGVWSYASQVTIRNSIVAFNEIGIAEYENGGTVTVSHNDVYGNASANYSNLTDATGTNGNISKDPQLSNIYHDTHLQPGSPCIDAGDDSVVTPGEADLIGKPRIIGSHVDIGADESDGTTWDGSARIWHVATFGNDANDGRSWTTAKKTLAAGIALAQGADEVWVARGSYAGYITIPAGVSLYGGFAGIETARDQRDWVANPTVLNGDGNTNAGVVTSAFVAAILDGFLVRSGSVGVLVGLGGLDIAHCTLSGNSAAGIDVQGGVATIHHCNAVGNHTGMTVEQNGTASISGCAINANIYDGIAVSGVASISDCSLNANVTNGLNIYGRATVERCAVSGSSHGMYTYGGSGTLSDSILIDNEVGVYVEAGTVASVNNCTISNNGFSGKAYLGVYIGQGARAYIDNCVVAFNGYGVQGFDGTSIPFLSHTDVYGSTYANFVTVADPTGTIENISADPRFVNRAGGDYHLVPGSPCIDTGDDAYVANGDTDFGGRPRIDGPHVDMGAYEVAKPWTVALGAPVTGGVTVAERVAYIAADDGKLYARSTEDGSATAGFPVDINAAVGATVKLPSRPAVYYGKTGKAIYLTTDRGDVLRILPSGTVAWHVRPLTGQTVSTPAVTPDGYVYVNLSTGDGPFNNYVFKLDEATGTPLSLSPFLGCTTADNLGDFSPAADSRYLYVNSGWASGRGLSVLNQDNLAVRSSFAAGERALSPLLIGSDLILATRSGKVLKMNAVSLIPSLGFGRFGIADIGSPICAAPFTDAPGNIYIGTTDGRILTGTPGTGAFWPLYSTDGKVAGLTVDRAAGIVGFGTSGGRFVQIPVANPDAAVSVPLGSPVSTGTVYESLTGRFIVVTDTGVLSGYPSIG